MSHTLTLPFLAFDLLLGAIREKIFNKSTGKKMLNTLTIFPYDLVQDEPVESEVGGMLEGVRDEVNGFVHPALKNYETSSKIATYLFN